MVPMLIMLSIPIFMLTNADCAGKRAHKLCLNVRLVETFNCQFRWRLCQFVLSNLPLECGLEKKGPYLVAYLVTWSALAGARWATISLSKPANCVHLHHSSSSSSSSSSRRRSVWFQIGANCFHLVSNNGHNVKIGECCKLCCKTGN